MFVDVDKYQAAYLTQVALAQTLLGPAVALNSGSVTQYA